MLVRDAVEARMSVGPDRDAAAAKASLPWSLKADRNPIRTGMLRRLAASRAFALGDRSGVLRTAQNRSGRAFRLDVRQRVVVKALVSRHTGKGADRAAALAKHGAYLGRAGAGLDGSRPDFFDRDREAIRAATVTQKWTADRHHFRFIISPEHGDRIDDMKAYVREVMQRVSADLGEPRLAWIATCHFDTDQPHAHVLVRGLREDGRDLVIPRDYVGYGFRARAQEVAHERLGDLSRLEAERRIWKETQADRFTGFDRRLLSSVDPEGLVPDGVGSNDVWSALTRGRLRHLEQLGLATRVGRRYRLDGALEPTLRTLQVKTDVIRTLNQRRLEGARDVRLLGEAGVRGTVVRTGFHDEAGAAPWVFVRDAQGVEHFARVRAGTQFPAIGERAALAALPDGVARLTTGRSVSLER